MTAAEGYGRTVAAPTCGECGGPSVWFAGRGRYCAPCLPATWAFWLLRGWLSKRIDAAFAGIRVDR